MITRPVVYHIPICPFSQRLEVLLTLRDRTDAVDFKVVDVTKPRDPELVVKANGSTALPILETPDRNILKESLVLLSYLDEVIDGPKLRRADPVEHAIESMLIAKEGPFTATGYRFVLNQDRDQRDAFNDRMLAYYRDINDFLVAHSPTGPWLFEGFSLAETVFAPIFERFWFLDYYEDFRLPDTGAYDRVRMWREACLGHPAAAQVTEEQVVKLYYDYSLGEGNGGLIEGRSMSTFAFEPRWQDRPWPPKTKYVGTVSDAELGLLV